MSIREMDARAQKGFVTEGFRKENGRCAMVSMAHLATIARSAIPPVAEFDAWLEANRSKDPRAKLKITGAKLRRIVQMRQAGQEWASINRGVGCSSAYRWYHQLPATLGGAA